MGYAVTALREFDAVEHCAAEVSVAQKSKRTSLTQRERIVVELSVRDTAKSIADIPPWRRTLAHFFKHEHPNRLANERLEELRRFAILARVDQAIDPETLDRFIRAGYSLEQASVVIRIVKCLAPKRLDRHHELTAWLVLAAVTAAIYFLVESVVEEALMSIIITGFIFATMASIMIPRDPRPH
ncbi:hypothetical protein [Novosphingobium gossypii]|uniref:hypothetical protein n=1 Tax=Novosphingobium gossypii TaxID=1604774 RepID=UPI003D1C2847